MFSSNTFMMVDESCLSQPCAQQVSCEFIGALSDLELSPLGLLRPTPRPIPFDDDIDTYIAHRNGVSIVKTEV